MLINTTVYRCTSKKFLNDQSQIAILCSGITNICEEGNQLVTFNTIRVKLVTFYHRQSDTECSFIAMNWFSLRAA